MTINLADIESEIEIAPSPQPDVRTVKVHANPAGPSTQETLPNLDSQEYKLMYLPTMLGVYTARHQQMPTSDESLREHVFGTGGYPGCEACREETEFLVAHQKKFF